MPGMENLAPERTETSRGLSLLAKAFAGLLLNDLQGGQGLFPHALREVLASVVVGITGFGGDGKAGGTGSPALVISATPAPLPPSSSRIVGVAFAKKIDPFARRVVLPLFLSSVCVICCVKISSQTCCDRFLVRNKYRYTSDNVR